MFKILAHSNPSRVQQQCKILTSGLNATHNPFFHEGLIQLLDQLSIENEFTTEFWQTPGSMMALAKRMQHPDPPIQEACVKALLFYQQNPHYDASIATLFLPILKPLGLDQQHLSLARVATSAILNFPTYLKDTTWTVQFIQNTPPQELPLFLSKLIQTVGESKSFQVKLGRNIDLVLYLVNVVCNKPVSEATPHFLWLLYVLILQLSVATHSIITSEFWQKILSFTDHTSAEIQKPALLILTRPFVLHRAATPSGKLSEHLNSILSQGTLQKLLKIYTLPEHKSDYVLTTYFLRMVEYSLHINRDSTRLLLAYFPLFYIRSIAYLAQNDLPMSTLLLIKEIPIPTPEQYNDPQLQAELQDCLDNILLHNLPHNRKAVLLATLRLFSESYGTSQIEPDSRIVQPLIQLLFNCTRVHDVDERRIMVLFLSRLAHHTTDSVAMIQLLSICHTQELYIPELIPTLNRHRMVEVVKSDAFKNFIIDQLTHLNQAKLDLLINNLKSLTDISELCPALANKDLVIALFNARCTCSINSVSTLFRIIKRIAKSGHLTPPLGEILSRDEVAGYLLPSAQKDQQAAANKLIKYWGIQP